VKSKTKIVFLIILIVLFIGISLSTSFSLEENKEAEKVESSNKIANSTTIENVKVNSEDDAIVGGDKGESEVSGLPISNSFSFLKSLMALTFVLGLIFLTAYLFKKITGIKTAGVRSHRVPIHMVGNLPLGDKKFLSIVEIQGKHYFLGISQGSINLLSKLDLDLPQQDEENDADHDFLDIFKKARSLLKNQYRRPMDIKK
jgi:flagellar biosynthetic protein FliO